MAKKNGVKAMAGAALRRRAMRRTLQRIADLNARRVTCSPYQSTPLAIAAEEEIYGLLTRVG